MDEMDEKHQSNKVDETIEIDNWDCYKCSESFSDKHSLDRHNKRSGSCIGVWYVCKRCLDFFDKPSELRKHQSLKRGCSKAVLSGKIIKVSVDIPFEAMATVRLKRGAEDAGNMMTYLEHVVARGNHQEMRDVLQACSIVDIHQLIVSIGKLADDVDKTGLFIDLLAILSDFSNAGGTSPEKKALLQQFIDENIVL